MKHLGFPKKREREEGDDEKGPPQLQQPHVGASAADKSVAVNVPRRPLLDIPVAIERSNPNCCVTVLMTFATAAVLGLCFVVVAIPPLFLDTMHGRRIYVAIMIPLLTVLCTVLLFYVMQQPQRIFNTAMVKMVKEMEHHSTYLSTAVDNVEKELATRGASLGRENGGSSSFNGRPRSHLATPEESTLLRTPAIGALRAASSTYGATAFSDVFRGIDYLDESRGVVISTVHVGKEWKWFNDTLGKLRVTTQGKSGFAGLAYQQGMVRMLSLAIARVEKLILSLYFSSFLLQHINAVVPLNLWGAYATAGGTPGVARVDMHARATAAMNRPVQTEHNGVKTASGAIIGGGISPLTQRSPLRLLGASGESITESTFTVNNALGHGNGGVEPDSPAFSAAGALDLRGSEETPTELTPPGSTQGFFGKWVHLPQFSPLAGSGETPPRGGPPLLQPQPSKSSGVTRATPKSDSVAGARALTTARLQARSEEERFPSASASVPLSPPPQRAVTKIGAHEPVVLSESLLECATEANASEKEEEDVDAEGVTTPPARVRGDRRTAVQGDGAPHSVVVVRTRTSGSAAAAAAAATPPAVPTPRPGWTPPQHMSQQSSSHRVASFEVSASPIPVKPPLPLSPQQLGAVKPRRLAGTAVVANPPLTLLRGARFVNDEESFFMTVLVHVREAELTCFSRLYAAQAHVRTDGKEKKLYFANTGGSSCMRGSSYNPLTVFHISDAAGEREGLTEQEQRLLSFVYCRPEHHSEVGTDGNKGATDLSSLAVKDGGSNSRLSVAGTEAMHSPSGSIVARAVTSVFADEVDAFILALGLLPQRAMRLTFLPVHVEAVGRRGMSHSFSSSFTSPSRRTTAPTRNGRESETTPAAASEAGVSKSEPEHPLPPMKQLPVLECVIDDVLCVLTKVEITVDTSFQRPSKILLVGVSLEDVSEGSERGVGDDDDDIGGDVDSLAEAQEPKQSVRLSLESSPNGRHVRSLATPQLVTVAPSAAAMAAIGVASNCTVGQEFRETIMLEQGSVSAEQSMGSAS